MEVDPYADSSFLVSLLRVDSNHKAAMRYMAQRGETLAFNPLHRVGVRWSKFGVLAVLKS